MQPRNDSIRLGNSTINSFNASYCKKCGGEYSPDTRYCSNCGQRTIPLSREMIFKWLHSEMPQVVATREDFSRIEQTASPILGKKGRAVFALTKFVAKNLLRR